MGYFHCDFYFHIFCLFSIDLAVTRTKMFKMTYTRMLSNSKFDNSQITLCYPDSVKFNNHKFNNTAYTFAFSDCFLFSKLLSPQSFFNLGEN